jgi:DNA modification methylase
MVGLQTPHWCIASGVFSFVQNLLMKGISMSKKPHTLTILDVPIDTLKAYKQNARTHSEKQVQQIAASIRQFGFMNPVLVDGKNRILAGHGRVEAAKSLNIPTVPIIRSTHLTEDQMRAYILADNKIAQNAGWNRDILAIELQHLSSIELDFDIEITGFSTPEIDVIIDSPTVLPSAAEDDVIPEPTTDAPAITQIGDIWELGKHRLICGNALEPETYKSLMGRKKAHMVFTDPPYNVPVDGHVCGLGKIKHREFAMASGEMSEEEFISFLTANFHCLKQYTADGSLHYICMDWRHIHEMMAAGRAVFSELKNLCVWAKDNGGMGSLYRSRHELVFVFKNGTGRHLNNVELGKHGRYRTNVWEYAGVNTARKGRMEELAMHPTVKPVVMVADAIKDCTRRGEAVLDPFAGSGTTIIAAEKTRRVAYAVELDPHYCDVILKRWKAFSGMDAIHHQTKQAFNQGA